MSGNVLSSKCRIFSFSKPCVGTDDTAQLVECLPSVPEAPGLILRILETMCAGTHMLSHHSGSGSRVLRSLKPALDVELEARLDSMKQKQNHL